VAHTAIGRQDVPLPRGTYETLPNHVIEPDGTPHAYAPPDIVSTEMHRLVTELSADDGTTHPLVMAAFAHHAFVAVHPFADGNGRVARLLASIYTMRAASVPLMIWSDQSVEYRAALKRADAGDPQPFVDFVFDRTIDAISLMTDRLRARSAETAIGDEEARAIAEEAQISAAARLWSTIERELVGIVAERPGQLAADHQELTFAGGGVEFPYGQAHRVVATRGAVSSARTFVVWCPRGRTDVVVVATDLHGERREFRVADIEPQLKTAAAEQARAYLRRVTLELLASMDR